MPPKAKTSSVDQIAGELDIHDAMISALVEVLEEKGQIKYDEWERRIRRKIQKNQEKAS